MLDMLHPKHYKLIPHSHSRATIVVAEGESYPIAEYGYPKEIISINTSETGLKIIDMIPVDEDGKCKADIIVNHQIPVEDIEVKFVGNDRGTIRVKLLSQEEILKQFETEEEDYIAFGQIKITTNENIDGVRPAVCYAPLLMNKEDFTIGWNTPIMKVSDFLHNLPESEFIKWIEWFHEAQHEGFAIWLGIQYALLNPVIRERTRMEKIPYESKSSNKKSKKSPKRYVKRITLGDFSDMTFGEKKSHSIHEPFWWVSGHWRQYSSGKRTFIQGYWKGPFKEYGNYIKGDPREREIVIE